MENWEDPNTLPLYVPNGLSANSNGNSNVDDVYLDLENPEPYANAVFDCRQYAFFTKDVVMLPFECLEKEGEIRSHVHRRPLSILPVTTADLESNIQNNHDQDGRLKSTLVRLLELVFSRFLPFRGAPRNSTGGIRADWR